jgi:hypothetical protein
MATPVCPVRPTALSSLQAGHASGALVPSLGPRKSLDDLLPLYHPEAGTHFLRVHPVGPHTVPCAREGLLPNTPLLAARGALKILYADEREPTCDLVVDPSGVARAHPGDPENRQI